MGFGFLALFLLVASLLTSVRLVLFGRDAEGRIVDLVTSRRITSVVVEYPVEGEGTVRSSRGGFNSQELVALAERLGRYSPGEPFEPDALLGAPVTVRYAVGRPTMAHIRAWMPLYRELLVGQVAWMVLAGLAWAAHRWRRGRAG
jgi:hypothetical protein